MRIDGSWLSSRCLILSYKVLQDCSIPLPSRQSRRIVTAAKLTPRAIQTTYGRLLESGGHGGRALSPRSVQQAHAVLHRAPTMAVKWRLLSVRPADAVEAPKPTKTKVRPFDETETVRLLAEAKGTAWHLPLLLAVATGMRRGEI